MSVQVVPEYAVVRSLAKLKPMHSVPPYLYKPETIQRFQARLREAFLGSDRATARVYLQNLVDHIVVGEDEIIIEAHAGAALAMISAPGTSCPEAATGEVLAHVVDWRALVEEFRTAAVQWGPLGPRALPLPC